jgi:hypothetical protein
MSMNNRETQPGMTLEQILSRHIADLIQTGNDDEAARLTMQGPIETAKSIEEVMARLNKELTSLSRLFSGMDGMDAPLHGALGLLQRCRLKYRAYFQAMLERRKDDQHNPTVPIFVIPGKSRVRY